MQDCTLSKMGLSKRFPALYPQPSSHATSLAPTVESTLIPILPTPSSMSSVSALVPTSTAHITQPQSHLARLILEEIKRAMDEENEAPDRGVPKNLDEFLQLLKPWSEKAESILEFLQPVEFGSNWDAPGEGIFKQYQIAKDHIDIREHWIRERVAAGNVDIQHVPSAENVPDVFTRVLPRYAHLAIVRALGLTE
ncbi:hypothetical protein B0H13DRAFT_2308241 [Mycena leptocephala]|nr:hypothetical protein B0H13DRAFT_2308241 [Mycena leptocephala]